MWVTFGAALHYLKGMTCCYVTIPANDKYPISLLAVDKCHLTVPVIDMCHSTVLILENVTLSNPLHSPLCVVDKCHYC